MDMHAKEEYHVRSNNIQVKIYFMTSCTLPNNMTFLVDDESMYMDLNCSVDWVNRYDSILFSLVSD